MNKSFATKELPRLSSVGTESVNIKRDLSIESMAKLVRRNFQTGRIDDSASADKGLVNFTLLTISEGQEKCKFDNDT